MKKQICASCGEPGNNLVLCTQCGKPVHEDCASDISESDDFEVIVCETCLEAE